MIEERDFEELVIRPDGTAEEFSTDWEELLEEEALQDRWARWVDSVDH